MIEAGSKIEDTEVVVLGQYHNKSDILEWRLDTTDTTGYRVVCKRYIEYLHAPFDMIYEFARLNECLDMHCNRFINGVNRHDLIQFLIHRASLSAMEFVSNVLYVNRKYALRHLVYVRNVVFNKYKSSRYYNVPVSGVDEFLSYVVQIREFEILSLTVLMHALNMRNIDIVFYVPSEVISRVYEYLQHTKTTPHIASLIQRIKNWRRK